MNTWDVLFVVNKYFNYEVANIYWIWQQIRFGENKLYVLKLANAHIQSLIEPVKSANIRHVAIQ